MLSILFWNSGAADRRELIATLVDENHVDILVLAETSATAGTILQTLNARQIAWSYSPERICKRVKFVTRFDGSLLKVILESDRYSIRRLSLAPFSDLLIVGAHMPSQMHYQPFDIAEECRALASDIARAEDLEDNQRTLLIGDLNLNPFDDGIAASSGLHATNSRSIARRGERTVQKKRYRFFYNPMWSVMHDRSDHTAGTYYYPSSSHRALFWHTFDQALLRPGLLSDSERENVRVLTKAGSISLVDKRGRPDKKHASDHLPILLQFSPPERRTK